MKSLFLFATLAEAQASINRFMAHQVAENVFSFGIHSIVIVGMGPQKASCTVEGLPTCGVRWVNVGIAGSIDRSLPFGSLCRIGTTAFLCKERAYDHQHIREGVDTLLYTSPFPVYEAPACCKQGSLIDMEGHVIAKIALQKKVPFSLLKVVSDYCSQDTTASIKKHMGELSSMLSEVVDELALG